MKWLFPFMLRIIFVLDYCFSPLIWGLKHSSYSSDDISSFFHIYNLLCVFVHYSAFWRESAVCLCSPWHLAISTPILVFSFLFQTYFISQFLWTSDFILAYCLPHFPFTSCKGQNAFFNRLQVAILSFLLILFFSQTIFLRHVLLLKDIWSHALFLLTL